MFDFFRDRERHMATYLSSKIVRLRTIMSWRHESRRYTILFPNGCLLTFRSQSMADALTCAMSSGQCGAPPCSP